MSYQVASRVSARGRCNASRGVGTDGCARDATIAEPRTSRLSLDISPVPNISLRSISIKVSRSKYFDMPSFVKCFTGKPRDRNWRRSSVYFLFVSFLAVDYLLSDRAALY